MAYCTILENLVHCVAAAVVVVANVAGDGGALHPQAVGPIWDPL